jgi:hypothetical protein
MQAIGRYTDILQAYIHSGSTRASYRYTIILGAIGPYRYTGILQVCRHPKPIQASYSNQVFGHPAGITQDANYCLVFLSKTFWGKSSADANDVKDV